MLELHRLTTQPEHRSAATHHLDWVLAQQDADGWYRHCAFTPQEDPFTHTIAYTAEGLYRSGELLGEERYIAAGQKTADRLLQLQRPDGSLAKCDMCIDRVSNGLLPACVKTCPTGAMNFGDYKEMRVWAQARLAEVRHRYPKATLLNPDKTRVIYLVAYDPNLYWEYAVASEREIDITRAVAMQRMLSPLRGFFAQLG